MGSSLQWCLIAASLAWLGRSTGLAQDLKFDCSDASVARLGVKYNIKYYSGIVTCGSLLLESDIGGSHAWIPPAVTYSAALEGDYYALIYVDPDVDLPRNGSWPDVTTPGSKAPARHWVVGNIDASLLKSSGDLTTATQVSAFKGPSPPWGSHRYGQFLFRQSSGRLNFKKLPSPDGIYTWDYKSFISEYQLGAPVATNFHITQHMPPRSALDGSRVMSAKSEGFPLKFECSEPPLVVAYDIRYYNGRVTCGNLILESDIGGTHAWIAPSVKFPTAEDGALYTLIYVDPDVDLPHNGSWPDIQQPGSKAPARHWVVGNIDAAMLQVGNLSSATQVSAFKGPSPPWGSHRYGQFLFKQHSGHINFDILPSPTGIYTWDYTGFITKYELGDVVASNFHITQHMPPRVAPDTAAKNNLV